jgi:O-antigen ligase
MSEIRHARPFLQNKMGDRIKQLFFILLFILFLDKFSFSVGGDGLSGNYAFVLLPIGIMLMKGKIVLPGTYFKTAILIYFLIFIISTAYQVWFFDLFLRRFSSFFIFIIIFSYLLIEVDEKMVSAFKWALVLMSVVLSLSTIITYVALGGAALGDDAKSTVGGQRYGFVYVLAFWVLLFQQWRGFFIEKIKYVSLFIIFIGLLLTFSRSSVVSLAGSFILFGVVYFFNSVKNGRVRGILMVVLIGALIIAIVAVFNIIFPDILGNVFYRSLFSFFNSDGAEAIDLSNEDSSEGFRLYMLKLILNYVSHNPFTGSGFLGVWILFKNQSGSAHNQYTDMLFRTGIFGFLTYAVLLFTLGRFLYKKDKGIFWGYIGVIIYGFFNETFKESHGGCILAFLIGMFGTHIRNKRLLKTENGVANNRN